ncbi:hypothetical protein MTR67_018894 [Solanum verrucosum]|uniref:Uncharacterized protein n=1 Tax=Solanum verrucosum TaxID=315347 RepID=A0AAF0TN22_SOLVR|nr:hypothetical protein MTR67_018894 [Solanum verrucosum]
MFKAMLPIRDHLRRDLNVKPEAPQALVDPLASRSLIVEFGVTFQVPSHDCSRQSCGCSSREPKCRLMTHAQQIEKEKLKESVKDTKRAWTDSGDYSHQRSNDDGRSPFRLRHSVLAPSSTSALVKKSNKDRIPNPKPYDNAFRDVLSPHIKNVRRAIQESA